MTGTEAIKISKALLHWYARNARDLPWRRFPAPYAVLVSEIMLQQTQVSTVIPYFLRWMERFPDFGTLAEASEEEVLKLWEGLGYYRRARSLHALARLVIERHAGNLPEDEKSLLALPGIGPYTAGALLSIAFNLPFPAVDGNVERVLARLFDLALPVDRRDGKERIRELARQLIPTGEPRHLTQALMELGATVCTPVNPHCSRCPLNRCCEALAGSTVPLRPVKRPRPETVPLFAGALLAEKKGQFLLFRRPPGLIMGNLWEFPTFHFIAAPGPEDLARSASSLIGLETGPSLQPLGRVRHAFTRYRVTLKAFLARNVRGTLRGLEGWEMRWADPRELPGLTFSAGSRKIRENLPLFRAETSPPDRQSRDILETIFGGD